MKIVINEKDATGVRTAKVIDGDDVMEWGEFQSGTWTKFHAAVKGQLFGISHGVWAKKGRGKRFAGTDEQLRALEQYFRDNIRSELGNGI